MEKEVYISICGTQTCPGEEPQTIELTTLGTLISDDASLRISYEESEVTGLDGVTTTFLVFPDRVELQRVGSLTSTMVFQPGKKHESLYDMGFGAMLLGIYPRTVRSTLGEQGGELFVDYTVEIEHESVGTNTYDITVRLANQSEN